MLLAVLLFAQQADSANKRIPVPEFVLEVVLTDEAERKLKQVGESIMGVVFFDGEGQPLSGVKTAPFREVFLGQYDFEMETAGTLTVKYASISKEAFLRLKDENYHFFVNVFSARQVFKNNILDCTSVGGRAAELRLRKSSTVLCDVLQQK